MVRRVNEEPAVHRLHAFVAAPEQHRVQVLDEAPLEVAAIAALKADLVVVNDHAVGARCHPSKVREQPEGTEGYTLPTLRG